MTTEERNQKMEALRAELDKLGQEAVEEQHKEILPFLQKAAICHYDMGCRILVEMSNEDTNKLYKIIDANGWYHVRGQIAENVTVSVDDGEVSIYVTTSGKTPDIHKATIQAAKDLGLKLSMERAKTRYNREIQRATDALKEITELEALLK